MNETNTKEYLDSLSMFGIRPGLENTVELLVRAGHPERDLKFIHIAGTNGKGSVGAMLDCALRASGFTTGFYSSPHLIDIRERFRVNGLAVSQEDFDHYAAELAAAARRDTGHDCRFTYFEFTTVLAAMIFARAGVDVVIWETGMGGRLDATNVVTPIASVITNIALDHQAYLGDTLEKIAGEKAGIIKPGIPVFLGVMPAKARQVLERRAWQQGAPCSDAASGPLEMEGYRFRDGVFEQEFEFEERRIRLPLLGAMQRTNFRLVASVLKFLVRRLGVDYDRALAGLAGVRWPGRCQMLNPRLLVDGGHNPDGLSALAEALHEIFPEEKFTVVFAGFRDKDVDSSLRLIAPLAGAFRFVPLHESDRPSYSGEELCRMAAGAGIRVPCHAEQNALLAVNAALADGSGRRVLAAGSLYLVGEVLSAFSSRDGVLDLV